LNRPKRVEVGEGLTACPDCRYSAGFHVGFRRKENRLEVVLICPSCRGSYRVGDWSVPSGEPRPFDPEVDIGT